MSVTSAELTLFSSTREVMWEKQGIPRPQPQRAYVFSSREGGGGLIHTGAEREVIRKEIALELVLRAKGREGVQCELDT